MKIIKILCLLASVPFLYPLSASCLDSAYSEIKFIKFPEEYQKFDQYPWKSFEIPEFANAYSKILNDFPADQNREDFIFKLSVTSGGNRFVSTKQGKFIFMAGCKPHFCGWSDIYVLYDPINRQAWAFIQAENFDSGIEYEVWLGKPTPKTKNLLKKLISMQFDRKP